MIFIPDKEITAINYCSYGFSIESGGLFEMKNNLQIAYYKDYVLYKVTTTNITDVIDHNISKDTLNTDINLSDTTGTKSFKYYVLKKGEPQGLVFDEHNKVKVFNCDSLIRNQGLNFKEYNFFSLDLGTPDVTIRNKKTNEIDVEKFANKIKGEDEPDSLYRYYNKSLENIDFSFSPQLDMKAKSKLCKIALVYNGNTNNMVKQKNHSRRESFWKIERINPSKEFLVFFEKFIFEHKKLN